VTPALVDVIDACNVYSVLTFTKRTLKITSGQRYFFTQFMYSLRSEISIDQQNHQRLFLIGGSSIIPRAGLVLVFGGAIFYRTYYICLGPLVNGIGGAT
jgi:hypothetical protein